MSYYSGEGLSFGGKLPSYRVSPRTAIELLVLLWVVGYAIVMKRPVFTAIFGDLYRVRIRAFLPTWLIAGSIESTSAVLPFHNFRLSPTFNLSALLRTGVLMACLPVLVVWN